MQPDDVHLLQSVSKSITGTLTGVLVARGVLAPDDLVTAHVPELAGTSFDGATVRHLLDMRAGTRFDETYADPASDLRASEAQFGWAPGPRPARDAVAYLSGLVNHRPHGGRFEYRSILTDVLGLVIERAAGMPFADTLGRELWGPMGAETDAYVTVDADGFPVTDGGICVSLRDLARFGRMVLDGGVVDSRQIVPAGWLADTLAGGEDSAEAFAQGEHSAELPGGHYRNQWWVPAGQRVFVGWGIHGQFLFVDRGTRTVIGLLSTWPTSLDPDRREAIMEAVWATTEELARERAAMGRAPRAARPRARLRARRGGRAPARVRADNRRRSCAVTAPRRRRRCGRRPPASTVRRRHGGGRRADGGHRVAAP